jgi:hypothetical protein
MRKGLIDVIYDVTMDVCDDYGLLPVSGEPNGEKIASA